MSKIFISHSSGNNDWAERVQNWLAENGWTDVFLDFDPERGIAAGERWKATLQKEAHRCELVLALVSEEWLASQWCKSEVIAARLMSKKIIVALIGAGKGDLPPDFNDDQWLDLANDPQGFTRLKVALRRAGLDAGSFPFEAGRRPYPGFAALDEDDAAIFFGREAQIVRALDKMRGLARSGVERMMVILGASGAGKSSFVHAGIWPRLMRDDQAWLPLPVIRPERNAISGKLGLAQAVAAVAMKPPFSERLRGKEFPETVAAIEQFIVGRENGLAALLAALREAAAVGGHENGTMASLPTVTLIVDQAEELLNTDGREEAERFIAILTRTLTASPYVLALVAIRSDAFPSFQLDTHLAACAKEIFTLDMMLPASFRNVIEGPAAVARPQLIVDPELTEALLLDLAGQDALPLLAFTLAQLYDRHRVGNRMTLAGYNSAGGLKGMIDEAVKVAVLEGVASGRLPRERTAQLALLRRAFIPHLATVNASGQFARRIAMRKEIPDDALPFVDCLVRARLLTSDRRLIDGGEHEIIEVAHEALLREWPDLNRELLSNVNWLRWLERVKDDHRQWSEAAGKDKLDYLLTGPKLGEAARWLAAHRPDVPEPLTSFIDASIAHKRRRQLVLASLPLYLGVPYVVGTASRFFYDARDYFTSGEPFGTESILYGASIGLGSWSMLALGIVYLPFALRRIFR